MILLNLFIVPVAFSRFFIIFYMDYHAADNKDNFIASFSVYLALFSCIIILARIPRIILNRSGENRYSCLIYFSEKTLVFQPLSMLLNMAYIDDLFQIGAICIFKFFNHEWMLTLTKCFFCTYGHVFYFYLFLVCCSEEH